MGLTKGTGLNEAPRRTNPPGPTARGARVPETAVRVDIGELALHGFAPGVDPECVTAAFQAELTRLVRERGVPLAADGEGRSLDELSGLPPLPSTVSATRLGEALARAVHAGLSGGGESGSAGRPAGRPGPAAGPGPGPAGRGRT
ncbi:hypothetical protein [Streptomyces sp. TP-A0874]|uniref:hypothetical protein n=1 Tax=Streptomyces sp. TP-A0874 TaxID=549819 RepID=UPI000B0C08A4|nr:hypothetical protein [Streptomyces sp. TP-A0874]